MPPAAQNEVSRLWVVDLKVNLPMYHSQNGPDHASQRRLLIHKDATLHNRPQTSVPVYRAMLAAAGATQAQKGPEAAAPASKLREGSLR